MRIILALLLCYASVGTVWAGYEPSGPRTYYNAETNQIRVATGGPLRNYFTASEWHKINPNFRIEDGQLISDSGYHKVITDPSDNIIWLDWNGHLLGIKVGKLFAYRRSIDQRYPIAEPDFTYRTFSENVITIKGIYPQVDLEIENRNGHLRHRFIYHDSARVAFEQWWQNNGQHNDIYLVNTFRLYVGQLNLNWRDRVGDFDLSVDRDITGLVELRFNNVAEFFLGDESVKLMVYPGGRANLYKRIMLIGGKPYLAEGFLWSDSIRAWPAGDISHNATFGETGETETTQRLIDVNHTGLSKQTMAAENGTLDSIYAFVHDNFSVDSLKFCIYSAADSSLLASAAGKVKNENSATTFGWTGDAVSVAVSASTDYWIGFNASNGITAWNAVSASGGAGDDAADPLPLLDPFVGAVALTSQFSIYGVYTADGAPATNRRPILLRSE